MHPAVGLSEHGLGSQGGCHQENRKALGSGPVGEKKEIEEERVQRKVEKDSMN